MTKPRAYRGSPWFALPKVPSAPRSLSVAAPVASPDAPVCACGCGRRILPLAQQHLNPYFSRVCREKHLRIDGRGRGA
jgi:hypothetical protein